jgi:tripartite-type tricarboxylate transporter receptor subunit TctC
MYPVYTRYRGIVAALGAVMAFGLPAVQAAEFGKVPVKLVVPFAPAGATDLIARTIAPRLSEKFGVQFVVVNTAGAAGTIGAASVANAEPDGNTLLVYHLAMVTTHHLQKNLPFDPLKSFTPIGMLAEASNVVAVNPNVPARSLADLVEHAKKNPGKVHFGSSGIGGSDHLGGELLQMVTNTKLTHVPYKGGGPATAAVVGGEIEMNAGTIAQVVPMIKAGKLRALAVMQTERSSALPDVPSAAEAGFPALDHKTWFGLWGPAKMPPELVTRINAALREVLTRDDVRQSMASVGVDPRANSPQEFDAYIKAQHARWHNILDGKFQ